MPEEATQQLARRGFRLDTDARPRARIRQSAESTIRELDHRYSNPTDVWLLWDAQTDRVPVAVENDGDAESLAFGVDAARALDAFRHPYAYASPHRNVAIPHRDGVAFNPQPPVRHQQKSER